MIILHPLMRLTGGDIGSGKFGWSSAFAQKPNKVNSTFGHSSASPRSHQSVVPTPVFMVLDAEPAWHSISIGCFTSRPSSSRQRPGMRFTCILIAFIVSAIPGSLILYDCVPLARRREQRLSESTDVARELHSLACSTRVPSMVDYAPENRRPGVQLDTSESGQRTSSGSSAEDFQGAICCNPARTNSRSLQRPNGSQKTLVWC